MFMSFAVITIAAAAASPCTLEQADQLISNQTPARALALCDDITKSNRNTRAAKRDRSFRQFLQFCRNPRPSSAFLCSISNEDVRRWRQMAKLSPSTNTPPAEETPSRPDSTLGRRDAPSAETGSPTERVPAAVRPVVAPPSSQAAFAGGTLDPTAAGLAGTAAQGLANFLVDQASKELQLFAVNRIRDRLCRDTGSDKIRDLLTHTCALFGGRSAFFSPSFGPAFVSAVYADIDRLPRYLLTKAAIPASESALVLALHLELLETLRVTQDPVAVVDALGLRAASYSCAGAADDCKTFRNQTRMSLLILKAALVATSSERFTASDDTHIQHTAQMVLGRKLSPQDRFALRRALSAARNVWRGKAGIDEGSSRARASVELIGLLVVSLNAVTVNLGGVHEFRTDLIGITQALAQRDMGSVLTRSIVLAEGLVGSSVVPDDAAKILAFGTDLARARTPEQAQAAIENFSAPIGSWRGKREGFGLYLNGLVGVGGGLELLVGTEISQDEIVPIAPTFVASLGLDINFAVGNNFTLGTYISLIDFGSLAAIRYDDTQLAKNDSDQVNDAEVSQAGVDDLLAVLAPGAFIRLGLGNTPLVLAAGANYVPRARTLRFGDGQTNGQADAVRIFAFLAVDITILPLSR